MLISALKLKGPPHFTLSVTGRVASSAATGGLMGSLGGAQVGMPSMMSNMGGGFGAQLGAGGQTQEEGTSASNGNMILLLYK